MKEKIFYGFCLLALLIAFSTPVDAASVRLSVAASLTEAFKEVIADYQRRTPEVQLRPNFASSGALARQIVAGAPADIYISANPDWMEYLQRQGLIVAASERVLLHNVLVFVGRESTAIGSLAELPVAQRIAIGSPKSAPVGRYAEQALIKAGLYTRLQANEKLVLAKDVRQALLYADRGEVDGAFVYRTDALLAKQAKVLFSVPQELYPQVVYLAALTETGSVNSTVEDFFEFLFSPSVQQVFKKYGFVIPE